jgi:predicted DNA-binding transcriptional regulator AlpA
MEERCLHRIIRQRDLPAFVGLQRTQIDELIKKGEFPQPIPLSDGGRAKGWLEDEVAAWQRQRLAKRVGSEKTGQPLSTKEEAGNG